MKLIQLTQGQSARCSVNGERKYLGVFPTKEAAYAAYVEAAKEHHGDFACL